MALEACPHCTRPVSPLAHFCVHCRARLDRQSRAATQFKGIDWVRELQEFTGALRNCWRRLKEYGPSTQTMFWLLAVSLLWALSSISSEPLAITHLVYAILVYAFLAFPALLAFLLLLLRRSFGLYGALAVFVFWFLSSGSMLYLFREHESSSVLFLWTIVAFISGWGTLTAFHEAAGGNVLMRLLAFMTFFSLEVGIVWASFYFMAS